MLLDLDPARIPNLPDAACRDIPTPEIFFAFETHRIEQARDVCRRCPAIRACLQRDDALLLGTDLVKPPAELIAAYDDATGVTAAFNLNLLARVNRELGADFVLRRFAHEARYDAKRRRIEMHLVSLVAQTVAIPGAKLTVDFEEGESIWTEAAHKFELEEVGRMASCCGFSCEVQWVDPEWPFAENLWIASGVPG